MRYRVTMGQMAFNAGNRPMYRRFHPGLVLSIHIMTGGAKFRRRGLVIKIHRPEKYQYKKKKNYQNQINENFKFYHHNWKTIDLNLKYQRDEKRPIGYVPVKGFSLCEKKAESPKMEILLQSCFKFARQKCRTASFYNIQKLFILLNLLIKAGIPLRKGQRFPQYQLP